MSTGAVFVEISAASLRCSEVEDTSAIFFASFWNDRKRSVGTNNENPVFFLLALATASSAITFRIKAVMS